MYKHSANIYHFTTILLLNMPLAQSLPVDERTMYTAHQAAPSLQTVVLLLVVVANIVVIRIVEAI